VTPELLTAFQHEIADVTAQLATETTTLEGEEDRDAAGRIRVRLRFLQKYLQTLNDGRNSIAAATLAVGEMVAKFDRWLSLCADARSAKDKMESLASQLPPAREAVTNASNAVTIAENALARHRRSPLPEFPTQPEIRKHENEETRIRGEHQAALQRVRELAQVRDRLEREWTAAAGRFDELARIARLNQVPAEPEPFRTEGELARVG
jgi:hypothetical protein